MRVRPPVVLVVVAGVLLLVAALAVCVALGPRWIVGTGDGLTVAERLKAENDIRGTLLQGLGGLLALGGVALGAAMTLRQVKANREGHSIDLFTKAIDRMASEHVTVRHGGIYALERLSELDPHYRPQAHALLTAFICEQVPWPPPDPDAPVSRHDDVSGAIGALGRRTMIDEGAWSELERVDLRHTGLDNLDIPRLCLAHSNLDGVSLVGAKLTGATLLDASFRGADLTNADLRSANLTAARLDGAILRGANLSGATLDDACLTGVIADHTTVWPDGFTPPRPPSPSD
jgi:uncharacterized protein YjbI with pentapeptide repeats